HFLGQIPQPIHSVSEMNAIFDVGSTSIQNLPTISNHSLICDSYHSCRHFLGLHLSALIMAIRVNLSLIVNGESG
ncbi:hypothetical protein BDB00DRAFT_759915, partial [Zychaea mexicana]|uniref:uncharacterized protein n=1 Tax=Zychaea mexicana TaxID=64656 RepID=UPI0022FE6184